MLPGIGQSSWVDEIVTISPPLPCAMNCCAANWAPKNALLRLTASTLSKSASLVSSSDVRVSIPALLTRTSSRPKFSTAVRMIRCRSSVRETSASTPTARPPARPAAAMTSAV